ncbi:MAG: GntR family transcriptional regulator [Acidobacteria bacterium]|nr:GntR family transcriptional regulator [Acidobacteriota bacterium]
MKNRSHESANRLADLAYNHVRDGILQGRLAPGAPLSRRRLAEFLGMSSVPVGEALTRLETEGVVESRPRAGTRVKIPSPDEIRGRYVVREALETHAARLFAELANRRDRRRLVSLARKLDHGYSSPDGAVDNQGRIDVERLHFDFHMFITRATGCKELLTAIERSRVLLSNWLFSISMSSPRLPERWHRDLADALVEGTPEQAAEAMRLHVRFRQQQVIDAFRCMNVAAVSAPGRVVRGPQRRTLERLKNGPSSLSR